MTYYIDIQNASDTVLPLNDSELTQLASLALRDHKDHAELTLRFVTTDEMIDLNTTYRKQAKTTNVLAFPCTLPDGVSLECPLLGDVIICPQVLQEESLAQNKELRAHWSLIVIHGVLHLLGYDHIKDEDAVIMQAVEIKLLKEMGYDNPYLIEDN
jgi:probable rRNA maturation factor